MLLLGHSSNFAPDNITFYKCDVSKWEEVEAISKRVIEEVNPLFRYFGLQTHDYALGWAPDHARQ